MEYNILDFDNPISIIVEYLREVVQHKDWYIILACLGGNTICQVNMFESYIFQVYSFTISVQYTPACNNVVLRLNKTFTKLWSWLATSGWGSMYR